VEVYDDVVYLLDSQCQWGCGRIRAAADDEVEIHKEKGLTLTSLWEVFEKVEQIVDYFKDNDPFYDSSRVWARNKGSFIHSFIHSFIYLHSIRSLQGCRDNQ
jgi:hypothetical protein